MTQLLATLAQMNARLGLLAHAAGADPEPDLPPLAGDWVDDCLILAEELEG